MYMCDNIHSSNYLQTHLNLVGYKLEFEFLKLKQGMT